MVGEGVEGGVVGVVQGAAGGEGEVGALVVGGVGGGREVRGKGGWCV